MVRLATHAHYRVSKRGLVLAGESGETVLFEHPRADQLPDLLADDPDTHTLADRLGPPLDPDLIADLVDLHILTVNDSVDTDAGPTGAGAEAAADKPRSDPRIPATTAPARQKRVTFTRSGIMIAGIAAPSRWLDRYLPAIGAQPGGWSDRFCRRRRRDRRPAGGPPRRAAGGQFCSGDRGPADGRDRHGRDRLS